MGGMGGMGGMDGMGDVGRRRCGRHRGRKGRRGRTYAASSSALGLAPYVIVSASPAATAAVVRTTTRPQSCVPLPPAPPCSAPPISGLSSKHRHALEPPLGRWLSKSRRGASTSLLSPLISTYRARRRARAQGRTGRGACRTPLGQGRVCGVGIPLRHVKAPSRRPRQSDPRAGTSRLARHRTV